MAKAKEAKASSESQTAQRKRYRSPTLTSFGTVTQLTRSNLMGEGTDGTMVNMRGS